MLVIGREGVIEDVDAWGRSNDIADSAWYRKTAEGKLGPAFDVDCAIRENGHAVKQYTTISWHNFLQTFKLTAKVL